MELTRLIGQTPLVDLGALGEHPGVRLLGKLEGTNPGGSVKDRAARAMIDGALERGELRPGITLLEATSGNTGIALAMIAAARGLPIELILPESATAERVQTLRAYGATVTLTPAAQQMEGAIDLARQKVASGGYLWLDQFANADNPRAHYETTGPELWRATQGTITHFVSAMGTTGTIMGVSRYLKQRDPTVQIVGVQPGPGARIPGIRRWSADYVPRIYEAARVDRIVDVTQEQAEATARELARRSGVFVGISSGGATQAALQLCAELAEKSATDATVVVVLCDRGDRYLSSGVFAIQADDEHMHRPSK